MTSVGASSKLVKMEQLRWPRLSDSVIGSTIEYYHNERVIGCGQYDFCEVGSKGCAALNSLTGNIGIVMYNVAEWFRCVRSPGRGGAGQRCFVCHASRHATRHASTCATIVS